MSDNRKETEADIVAEFRELAKHSPDGIIAVNGNIIADRIEAAWQNQWDRIGDAVLDFCNIFTLVYPPGDKDCPAVLSGAFEAFEEAMGIETVEIKKEGGEA